MNIINTPTYRSWKAMKQRCYREKDPYFAQYGGRGITVCDRWRSSFSAFLADMGERPAGTTLDRIKLDGNYEPSNCRWATRKEQNRNRGDTRWVTIGEVRKSLSEWCEERGLSYSLVRKRISEMGWSPEDALSMPTLGVGRRRNCKPRLRA